METNNGYKVPGAKMTSRFGLSHSANRAGNKFQAMHCDPEQLKGSRLKYATKRLAKKCKHKRLVDESYGGPESGCVSLYCKDCGWCSHTTLY